jgi:hypothetical protein
MIKHLAIIAALALATPAHAQTATADPDQVVALLKEAGYPAEPFGDQNGYRQVTSKAGDYEFSVDLFDCTAGKACELVLFYTAFKAGEDMPSKEAIAAYSGQQSAGRMFVDRRGAPVIELELNLAEGALNPAQFADSLKTWETMLNGFADFLSGRSAPAAAVPAAATAAAEAPAPAAAAETADAT